MKGNNKRQRNGGHEEFDKRHLLVVKNKRNELDRPLVIRLDVWVKLLYTGVTVRTSV